MGRNFPLVSVAGINSAENVVPFIRQVSSVEYRRTNMTLKKAFSFALLLYFAATVSPKYPGKYGFGIGK